MPFRKRYKGERIKLATRKAKPHICVACGQAPTHRRGNQATNKWVWVCDECHPFNRLQIGELLSSAPCPEWISKTHFVVLYRDWYSKLRNIERRLKQ